MPKKMTAVRKAEPGTGLVVTEAPVPEVAPDQVLVAVEAASICGSDLQIWRWTDWFARRMKPPVTVGHEFAGTVVEVGSAVMDIDVGDYVSAESHVTCGECFQCRSGQPHMCPRTRILGVDFDGAFADFVAVPEKVVWRNDRDKLPPELATLQEPFGNAVYATLEHDVADKTVGVLGCGPVGLFSIGVARAAGAERVLAADVQTYRLSLATTMGADAVFNPSQDGDSAEWLAAATSGDGVDVALEMSGAPSAIDAALRGTRSGGRVTLFGIPSKPVTLDVGGTMILKNLTVLALAGRRIFDSWYTTQWLLESGAVDLRPLVTHEMALEDIDQAVELLARGQAAKIVLRPKAAQDAKAHDSVGQRRQDASC